MDRREEEQRPEGGDVAKLDEDIRARIVPVGVDLQAAVSRAAIEFARRVVAEDKLAEARRLALLRVAEEERVCAAGQEAFGASHARLVAWDRNVSEAVDRACEIVGEPRYCGTEPFRRFVHELVVGTRKVEPEMTLVVGEAKFPLRLSAAAVENFPHVEDVPAVLRYEVEKLGREATASGAGLRSAIDELIRVSGELREVRNGAELADAEFRRLADELADAEARAARTMREAFEMQAARDRSDLERAEQLRAEADRLSAMRRK